jgi:hypothetical protein
MAYQYVQVEDCLDVADVLIDAPEKQALIRASLHNSLQEASRQFERETVAVEDFYAPFKEETTRPFRLKRGASLLVLPPFLAVTSITDDDDEEYDSNYYEVLKDVFGNYALKILSPIGCTMTRAAWFGILNVTASWGWQCVPADVQIAVKAKALLNWTLNPTNRKGLPAKQTFDLQDRLRGDYNRIVRQWAARNKVIYGGLGIG